MKRFSILIVFLVGFLFANPDTVSIKDIQYPGGNSPYQGQQVTTWGVVTAAPSDWVRSIHGFFIQDSSGPWQGIFVYTGSQNVDVQRGDSVLVVGEVQEYYECTEISYSSHVILKRGASIPLPYYVNTGDLANGAANAESFEGVLVLVNNVVVTDPDLGYGEWSINDGSGDCRVDDAGGYSYQPAQGDSIKGLIGVLHYSYGNYKVEPRGDEDFFFTLEGSGLSWSTTALLPDNSLVDSIVIYFYPVLTDTVSVVKVIVPPEFAWNGEADNVALGGAFEGAAFNIEGDGNPESPFVVGIETDVVRGDLSWVVIRNITTPDTGSYTFYILSGTPTAVDTLKHLPTVSILKVDGSGEVSLAEDEFPIGSSVDLGITLRSNFGRLTAMEIILPADAVNWSGSANDVIISEEFEGATVDSVASDFVRITGFHLEKGEQASLTLRGITATGTPGAYSLTIKTAGEGGTPAPISSQPYIFVLREDSTYPLRLFHEIPELLTGRAGTKVRGVVTANLSPKVFIQDSTGAIVLFAPEGAFSIGDRVWAVGTFSPYRGMAELQDPVIERREPASFDTLVITGSVLYSDTVEYLEGKFVHIPNVTTNPATLPNEDTIIVWDSTALFPVFIDPASGLAYREIPGGTFDLYGVIDERDSVYRIVPRGPFDMRFMGDGQGIASFEPPYIFIQDTFGIYEDPIDEIAIILRAWSDTIKSFSLELPSEIGDSVSVRLTGDLTGRTEPDTVIDRILYFNYVQLIEDTIWISNFTRPVEPCSLVFRINTSNDSAGILKPIFEQPVLYVVYPIKLVQKPGEDGYSSFMEGQQVTVAGVVTGPSEVFSPEGKTGFWIQDRSGGVNVFCSFETGPFDLGQLVLVKGAVTEYKGVTEISPSTSTNIKVLAESVELPAPETLRVSEALREDLEGLLLHIKECEVAAPPAQSGSGINLYVWNGQAAITVYVYPATGIDLSSLKVGDIVNVTGIVGQYDREEPYNAGYQLLPRIPEDLVVVTTLPQEEVDLTVSPNVFAPDIGEVLRIEVSGPADARYTLKVLDTEGREIVRLADSRTGPFTYLWKGFDERGNRVPIGLYILQLKVQKPQGDTKTINKVFVISTPF